MQTFVGIYQISISPEADNGAFEEIMRADVFPTVGVGKSTRGGMVTAQYLSKCEPLGSENDYSWIVHWENMGGSPFGSANGPADPAPKLEAFGAKTSFTRYVVIAEETS
jgi:hypothetical protein